MRILSAIALVAALVLLGSQRDAAAQWTSNKIQAYGLFGERQLGDTFKPRQPTRFGATFLRGPSGDFMGRDSTQPGMRFPAPYAPPLPAPGQPVQVTQQYEYAPETALPEAVPVLPGEVPAPGQIEPQPQPEQAPQIWFRGNAPQGAAGETGAVAAPVGTALPAAPVAPPRRPAIALGGVLESSSAPAAGPRLGFGSVDRALTSSLQSVIARIPRFQTPEPVRVSVNSGVATLQGAVATEHDRKVLAEFVRMEPGVWEVNNELTVRP